jgi:phosphoserine phosphatase
VATSAVFIDLDRTLLCHASGQVLSRAMIEEGVLSNGRSLPGERLLYSVNDRLGENLFSMGLVRAAAAVARGWRQDQVQAAGRRAVSGLSDLVAPFAPQHLSAFRAEGHKLVLSTTTPADMIAPFA